MTLEPREFIRRFLMHVLPKGFHRIRHYGLLTNGDITRREPRPRSRADRRNRSSWFPAQAAPRWNLRGHDPLRGARSSLSSLRQPHADHRNVRAGSTSSPSPLRAAGRHHVEYLMTAAPSPRSLSSHYRCLRSATPAHAFIAAFAPRLPRNRSAISTKSPLIVSFGAPTPPDRCHPPMSLGHLLHSRRHRNPHSARR
jgi:Putative transposase